MFNVPIIVGGIAAHRTIKNKVLKLIDEGMFKSLDTLGESIAKTDWDREEDKAYQEVVLPHLINAVGPIFHRMNYQVFDKTHMWFQQYEREDFHTWHRHPGTDWGLVYYIELPYDGPRTEFRNPLNEEETYVPEIGEGDFVLFPSFLEHRSIENYSTGRKTVIVTNFITT